MAEIQTEAFKKLIQCYKDDAEMVEVIMDALKSFETYHASIYRMETQKYLYAAGAMDTETYRVEIPHLDKQRTSCHNEVISNVKILNRLAQQAGLPPFYDGTVSEERPYRREVANAVLAFIEQVIQNRG